MLINFITWSTQRTIDKSYLSYLGTRNFLPRFDNNMMFWGSFLSRQHNNMATLFNDPFMEPQFSNRQSKTLPYQVQADTHRQRYAWVQAQSMRLSVSSVRIHLRRDISVSNVRLLMASQQGQRLVGSLFLTVSHFLIST